MDIVDYYTMQKVRQAVGRELARRVNVTDEMVQAYDAYMKATRAYREQIRIAADQQKY